jgi:hypothetical protein
VTTGLDASGPTVLDAIPSRENQFRMLQQVKVDSDFRTHESIHARVPSVHGGVFSGGNPNDVLVLNRQRDYILGSVHAPTGLRAMMRRINSKLRPVTSGRRVSGQPLQTNCLITASCSGRESAEKQNCRPTRSRTIGALDLVR